MTLSDEVIILVDKDNTIIGDVPRRLMDFRKSYHRVTYIFVFNKAGDLLVQKRTDTKAFCPGYYGITTGGVVEKGETYIASAHRELQEELGFDAPLESQGVFCTKGEGYRIWGKAYSCQYDPALHGELNLQPKEVASLHEMSIDSILQNKNELLFTPDSVDALKHFLNPQTSAQIDDPL